MAPRPRPSPTVEDERIALTPVGAEYLASQPSAPDDTDVSRAYLAKLITDQSVHAASLHARGSDPQSDPTYRQRAEWIAGLEARHARQERDSEPTVLRAVAQ